MKKYSVFTTIVSLCFLLSGCYKSEEADLVIHNARIYSVDESFAVYDAMAIKDGVILELGPEREIMNRYSAKETVDAMKRPVYPGFYDAHSHFLGYARNKTELNLFGVESPEKLIERVRAFAEKSDREWIIGRGWDQNTWQEKTFPTNTILDSLYPNRPVMLTRIDGHAVLVNSEAMRRAGLDAESEIPGGAILLDDSGKPTGILLDLAAEEIENIVPPLPLNSLLSSIKEAEAECFAAGLTTVTDAGLPLADIRLIDSLQQAGSLLINIYAMLRPSDEALAFMASGTFITERLTVRSLKIYADGALGSRGALLKKPYTDQNEKLGLALIDSTMLYGYAKACFEYGYQCCAHCIGDSANAMVLQAYADVLGGITDLRWRIEHAQVVAEEDLHYFKDYAIIPSVQPLHATSDMVWAADRLGHERIKTAYAFQDLRRQLGILALGTDFPVEPISPIGTFYAAVFRKTMTGSPDGGFQMENALTREQALRGMTIWAAIASFEEEKKGSLEPGKIADLVILDRDILEIPEDKIPATKVVATFSRGRKVY